MSCSGEYRRASHVMNRVPYKYELTSTWKRSEEHTSELQSRENLVCRLLLEKKKPPRARRARAARDVAQRGVPRLRGRVVLLVRRARPRAGPLDRRLSVAPCGARRAVGARHLRALAPPVPSRVARLLVRPAGRADGDPGVGRLALARRRHARGAARPVGVALHGGVRLARAGPPAAVANGVAADRRPRAGDAPSTVRHAGAGRTLRQRLRVSVHARAERALHRSRAGAAQRARAGGRLRARSRAPRALRSAALPDRVGYHVRTRGHRAAGRRPRPRPAARGTLHALLVARTDHGLPLEDLASQGARDRERRPCARAV